MKKNSTGPAQICGEKLFFVLLILSSGLGESRVLAWGERGHHVICEAATRLVREEGLKSFLSSRSEIMGHLCNVPDIYWRNLPEGKSGDATHYINPEKLTHSKNPLLEIPTSIPELVEKASSKDVDIAEMGTLWWRAAQFYARAGVAARRATGANPPADKKGEQDPAQPYNEAIYFFLVNAGLMGHFVGDASMPYHSTVDYDGWATGHGGIHRFFEESVVNALPLTLLNQVFVKAKAMKRKEHPANVNVAARLKELSLVSFVEIAKVQNLDKILHVSSAMGDKKLPAERPAPELVARSFESLIVSEMARSSSLLAEFWDDAYVEAGRPDLGHYKLNRYPLEPDFVPVDYLPSAKEPEESGKAGVAASGIE